MVDAARQAPPSPLPCRWVSWHDAPATSAPWSRGTWRHPVRVSEADVVCVGSWVQGLLVVGQHPIARTGERQHKLARRPCPLAALRASKKGSGAGDEIRTRDIQLGRLALYQLSYSRVTPMIARAVWSPRPTHPPAGDASSDQALPMPNAAASSRVDGSTRVWPSGSITTGMAR